MAQASLGSTARPTFATPAGRSDPAAQTYFVLYTVFILLPIVAGCDKFLHILVNWDQYLTPLVPSILGIPAHTFMFIVGVIEICAGILVAIRPHIGAYVVTAWLWAIVVNLFLVPGYYDIAVRDFVISLSALMLGRLSTRYGR